MLPGYVDPNSYDSPSHLWISGTRQKYNVFESKLEETQKELNERFNVEDRVHILAGDVSNAESMKSGVEGKMKELGWEYLDAVVANAGKKCKLWNKTMRD